MHIKTVFLSPIKPQYTYQNVIQLEIPVNHFLGVDELQGIQNLLAPLESTSHCFLCFPRFACFVSEDVILETVIAQFENQSQ